MTAKKLISGEALARAYSKAAQAERELAQLIDGRSQKKHLNRARVYEINSKQALGVKIEG